MFHVQTGSDLTRAPASGRVSDHAADIQSFYLNHQEINAVKSPKLANALAEYLNSWSQETNTPAEPAVAQREAGQGAAPSMSTGYGAPNNSRPSMVQNPQQMLNHNKNPVGIAPFKVSSLPRATISRVVVPPPSCLPHRSLRACKRCRQGKQKCNGQLPCTKCATRGHECVYEERPLKKPSTTAAAPVTPVATSANTASSAGSKQGGTETLGRKRKLTISTAGISAFEGNPKIKIAKPMQHAVDPARNMGGATHGYAVDGSFDGRQHQHQHQHQHQYQLHQAQMQNHHQPSQHGFGTLTGYETSSSTPMMHNPTLLPATSSEAFFPFPPSQQSHQHNFAPHSRDTSSSTFVHHSRETTSSTAFVHSRETSSNFEHQLTPQGYGGGQQQEQFPPNVYDHQPAVMLRAPANGHQSLVAPSQVGAEMHYAQHEQQAPSQQSFANGHGHGHVGGFPMHPYAHSNGNFSQTTACSTPETWPARQRSDYLTPDVSYRHPVAQQQQASQSHGHGQPHLDVLHQLGTHGHQGLHGQHVTTPISTTVATPTSELGAPSVLGAPSSHAAAAAAAVGYVVHGGVCTYGGSAHRPSQLQYEQHQQQGGYDFAPPSVISSTAASPGVGYTTKMGPQHQQQHAPLQQQANMSTTAGGMVYSSTMSSPSTAPPSPALTMLTSSQTQTSQSQSQSQSAASSITTATASGRQHQQEEEEEEQGSGSTSFSIISTDGSSAAGVLRRKDEVTAENEDEGKVLRQSPRVTGVAAVEDEVRRPSSQSTEVDHVRPISPSSTGSDVSSSLEKDAGRPEEEVVATSSEAEGTSVDRSVEEGEIVSTPART
ncbi:unnamed protein product [Tilletia controversa]|nr:unnamed protein product [Tilletia controversa]